MAGLKQEQLDFIRSLHYQGILDNNFDCLFEMRDKTENPQFVIEVVGMFCNNADISIANLNRYMIGPTIYEKVGRCAHQLKGCASGIGCCRLASACAELHRAAGEMNKERIFSDDFLSVHFNGTWDVAFRCLEAFNKVKNEYQTIKGKLDEIVGRETQILVWECTVKKQLP